MSENPPQRKKAIRCPICKVVERLCICDITPSIKTNSKLCLIIQNREIKKTTNTGLLASRCLQNSEVHVRGNLGEQLDYNSMVDESYENIFLFPTKNSIPLDKNIVSGFKKPVKLFVADGNWGQAIRIHRKFMRAHPNTPNVFLPPGKPTQYFLRKESGRAEGLATMEAIARAFGIIESPTVEQKLTEIFLIMVKRTFEARGTEFPG